MHHSRGNRMRSTRRISRKPCRVRRPIPRKARQSKGQPDRAEPTTMISCSAKKIPRRCVAHMAHIYAAPIHATASILAQKSKSTFPTGTACCGWDDFTSRNTARNDACVRVRLPADIAVFAGLIVADADGREPFGERGNLIDLRSDHCLTSAVDVALFAGLLIANADSRQPIGK